MADAPKRVSVPSASVDVAIRALRVVSDGRLGEDVGSVLLLFVDAVLDEDVKNVVFNLVTVRPLIFLAATGTVSIYGLREMLNSAEGASGIVGYFGDTVGVLIFVSEVQVGGVYATLRLSRKKNLFKPIGNL